MRDELLADCLDRRRDAGAIDQDMRRAMRRFRGIKASSDESDRMGLASSSIAAHIHRDESNVFRRALLYNLAPGADAVLVDDHGETGPMSFLVLSGTDETRTAVAAVLAEEPAFAATYDLSTGDPGSWNHTDVDEDGRSRRFTTLVVARWRDEEALPRLLTGLSPEIAIYVLEATYVMVDGSRATPLSLRD